MESTKSDRKRVGRPPKLKTEESPTRSRVRRSPARRQPSPDYNPKSTGRKSPSRKSPARKSPSRRSPSRKSPSRTTASIENTAKAVTSRPALRSSPKVVHSVKNNTHVQLKNIQINIKSSEYDLAEIKKSDTNNGYEPSSSTQSRTLRERKPRLTESISSRKIFYPKDDSFENLLHLAQNTALPKSGYSIEKLENDLSEDDSPLILREARKLITPVKEIDRPKNVHTLLMPFGVVFMLLLVLTFNLCCNKQPCSFTELPDLSSYNIRFLPIFRSFVLILSLTSIIFLSSFIPLFGKKITLVDGKKPPLIANGLFCFLTVISMIITAEYFGIPVTKIIYEDYIQMELLSVLFGTFFSVILFIKGGKVPENQKNPNANTGNKVYDFMNGREINPIILKKTHIKFLLLRFAYTGMISINLTWIYYGINSENIKKISIESLTNADTYFELIESTNWTLLSSCIMQILYGFYFLGKESTHVFSLEFTHEGLGFVATTGYFLYPFLPTIVTKYLLDHDVQLPYVVLIGSALLYSTGYYIFSRSNFEKSVFRENPLNPKVSHLKTLPTFHGKKLLISGCWGFVRHPNYLGDILIHVAWAIGCYNSLAIYTTVLTLLYICYRAKHDSDRCSEQYGIAWKRYCQKVPYYIFPRIY